MEKNTMKLNVIIALFSAAMLATSGYSQNSGGTGTTPPGQPTGPTTPGAAGTPPPTLNPGIGENSFQARPRTQPAPMPGQVLPGQIVTNSVVTETNQFTATNLPPTSLPGFTNRIMATNGSTFRRDQAISEGDRQLLVQIRTAVFGTAQVTATTGAPDVHFILRDGAVRIVGVVPTPDEQRRIETAVQQVPGVVRVFNALQVGATAAPGQTSTPGQLPQTPATGQTPVPSQPPTPGQPH
jgi:BON domain